MEQPGHPNCYIIKSKKKEKKSYFHSYDCYLQKNKMKPLKSLKECKRVQYLLLSFVPVFVTRRCNFYITFTLRTQWESIDIQIGTFRFLFLLFRSSLKINQQNCNKSFFMGIIFLYSLENIFLCFFLFPFSWLYCEVLRNQMSLNSQSIV